MDTLTTITLTMTPGRKVTEGVKRAWKGQKKKQRNQVKTVHPFVRQFRNKKPSSVMTRPLPLSSTEGHCWSFINAKINLPLLSLSLSATVYLQCGYVFIIVCVPSYSCLVLPPPPPFPFVSLPLYLSSHLFSLFTVHLFLYLQWLTGSSSVSGYQRKLRFCCKQIAPFFRSFSCCILCRKGDGKAAPVKSACSWPWRMHLH